MKIQAVDIKPGQSQLLVINEANFAAARNTVHCYIGWYDGYFEVGGSC
jgi:hypothetical protein